MTIGVLTTTDIDDIRQGFIETMPAFCTISVPETDDDGLSTGGTTTLATNVPCGVRLGGSGQSPVQNTQRPRQTAQVSGPRQIDLCYYDGPIRLGATIEITDGSQDLGVGSVYTVLNAPTDLSYLFVVTVDVELVKAGVG